MALPCIEEVLGYFTEIHNEPECDFAPTRSASNHEVQLEFRNASETPVCICWVDRGGLLQQFREVPKHGARAINTNPGHNFLIGEGHDAGDFRPVCNARVQRARPDGRCEDACVALIL